MIALILAGAVIAAVFIPWAVRNDNLDAHLLHGPNSGCLECEAK